MTARNLIPTPPARPAPSRCTGRVKWYDAHRRFGFIEPADESESVWFHIANARNLTPTSRFAAGDPVSYELGRSSFGARAFDIAAEVASWR